WALWMSTGAYVRSQAWQIGLALDCRKAFRMGIEPGHQPDRWMNWVDRWFDPLTNHFAGFALTALLVKLWFAWQLFSSARDPGQSA
ncbi:MAG: TIGR04283 family arsenosugar biosynthesis glycosyltransferase, partial [Desulfuromonadales bacterium]